MVRLWSEEVGDARSVIEPLVREIDPHIEIEVDGEEGFRKDTVEVRLQKSGQQAVCIVTFEAWTNAKTSPTDMEAAFREIISEVDQVHSTPTYMLTSRGLDRERADKGIPVLRDIAAGTEADILAEQLSRQQGSRQ